MTYTLYLGTLIVLIAIVLILIKNQLQLKKTFFPAFLVLMIVSFLCYMSIFFGITNPVVQLIASIWIYTVFAIIIIHSSITLGNKKTLIFYVLALLFGAIPELIGVKYGWIFGHYYYNPSLTPFILGLVPVTTVLSWAVVIYISYILADIILKFGSKKPNFKSDSMIHVLIVIFGLSLISGYAAVNLDMLIDPVVVATQGWFWIGGGPYYGVPIGNFAGWFLIACLATLTFRFIESVMDKKKDLKAIETPILDLSMISVYVMFFLIYGYSALLLSHPEYLLIGSSAMGPFIVITILITFIKYTRKVNNHG